MTARTRFPLLALAIAGLLLSSCSLHRDATPSSEHAVREAPPPAAPAPVALAAPAADAALGAARLEAVAVSASRARSRGEARASKGMAAVTTAPASSAPALQAGTLTAGDYDDLLNPQLYARYAERYLQGRARDALPFVDTRTPLKVRVVGRDGRPVAFAQVALASADGIAVQRPTAANGHAVFFPALDRLPGRLQLTVTTNGAAPVRRALDLADLGDDRGVTIELPIAARAPRALDLLLAIDTTGSMGDELAYLQAELDAIVASLRRIRPGTDLRVGLVVYRDHGDDYVTRSVPFTHDLAALRAQLGAQRAEGGGDYPEAVDQALAEANRFDWRDDAVGVLLHVADAPPHAEHAAAAWREAMALRARGVHIVPVAASGVAEDAQYLMRAMAALTQSRYLFLTDDSGVGLAHAEPDVPCYIVTRLDGLIERVVASLLLGRRVEPAHDAVLRRVGDYDRGTCLPASTSRRPLKIAD